MSGAPTVAGKLPTRIAAVVAAVMLVQIATPADAALAITSSEVVVAVELAKRSCAFATQTASLVLVDPVTLANLMRIRVLCDVAAGFPLPSGDWPEEIENQVRSMFDAASYAKAVEALRACADLAARRASAGQIAATASEIERIARPTRPAGGGMAVFDPYALTGLVEIAVMCGRGEAEQ